MCGDKDKFMKLGETVRGNVTFADHSKVAIKGKCMILIKLKDESHQFIGDVYYIPTVKSNILSLRQLLEKEYEIKIRDRTLTLLDTKGDMIAKVAMTKTIMFLLNIKMDVPESMCGRWNLALTYETWACKLWYLEDNGTKRNVEGSTIHYTSKSVVWKILSGQVISHEFSK